jgi:hypothetical protein
MSLAASAYFAAKKACYAARKDLHIGDQYLEIGIPMSPEAIQRACGVPNEALLVPE